MDGWGRRMILLAHPADWIPALRWLDALSRERAS